MRLAFTVCLTQLVGMGSAIYGFSDWNDVEPFTFIITAFWLMTGSTFYFTTKMDFSYQGSDLFDQLKNKTMKNLVETNKFDTQKQEFLEMYIEELQK